MSNANSLEALSASWLENEDEGCRQSRLERLRWLAEITSDVPIFCFHGGFIAKSLFDETRYCFAYGQFLATTVLGLAFVEQTLAALFFADGRDDLERASISSLLNEALASGWIADEEFAALNRARTCRNPITHFRRPMHDDSIEVRSIEDDEYPYDVIEADARHVIAAMMRVFGRISP